MIYYNIYIYIYVAMFRKENVNIFHSIIIETKNVKIHSYVRDYPPYLVTSKCLFKKFHGVHSFSLSKHRFCQLPLITRCSTSFFRMLRALASRAVPNPLRIINHSQEVFKTYSLLFSSRARSSLSTL